MSGLTQHTPHPTEIRLHQASRKLELSFDNDKHGELSCEFLRVHSPSAEVQGHGNPVLQTGKINVNITAIEPVGHYAVKLSFDDGHDTGLYSWDYLYQLLVEHDALWQKYLDKLAEAGASREPGN